MVVENVRGAQPWVGPAAWNYGSYYLWGDVPALMPNVVSDPQEPRLPLRRIRQVVPERERQPPRRRPEGAELTGRSPAPGQGARFTSIEPAEGRKGAGAGAAWFDQNLCQLSSKSSARKAASAKIAKIPFALSSHIARV
jgi:hypothetical protein